VYKDEKANDYSQTDGWMVLNKTWWTRMWICYN